VVLSQAGGKGKDSGGLCHQLVEQVILGLLESGDGLCHLRPVPRHGIGVALGLVVLPVGQRGLGDQGPQASVVGLLGQLRELVVGDPQLLPERRRRSATSDRRRSTLDRDMADHGTSMSVPAPHNGHDRAVAPRPVALVLAGALALGVAACGSGGSGAEGACGPITREALDRGFLVHVLEDDPSIEYTSDPPTSGPHRPSPPVSGTWTSRSPGPCRSGSSSGATC
jgi:hypothetical protein